MPFFDFHLHPTLKSLFSAKPEKLSPWDKLDTRKIPNLLQWCTEFEYILQSQASLTQLVYNECNLLCVALYAPEKAMLNNQLILGQADGSLKPYLNKARIQSMINSQLKPYADVVVRDDLDTLLNAAQFNITDKKVVKLTKPEDFKQEPNTIYVVFSVEGCHSFTSALRTFDVNEIIANLDDLRSRVALLSINLTHLEQSKICNHAFGMLFIPDESFKPTGRGISPDGIRIIKHCYEKKIMIDVKHMSLGARKQFYQVRTAVDFADINQPIACTHAGFTGISWNSIPDYILDYRNSTKGYTQIKTGKPIGYGRIIRPSFNASSINLYDEDIMQILRSGGMIGLSLDKRILGYQEAKRNTSQRPEYPLELEYLSVQEEVHFFTRNAVGDAFLGGKCLEWEELEQGGVVNPVLADYHLRHFMSHIIHLIAVAKKNIYDVNRALTQVCIGSDYDGIINPVWCCDTVDELTYFKEAFEKSFMDYAKECAFENKVELPAGFDVKKFSDQLFFENGKNFVLERLTKLG